MANRGAGGTAIGAAICRLIEQYEPAEKRLFTDSVIEAIVPWPLKAASRFSLVRNFFLRKTEEIAEGTYGALVCRVRYDDDLIDTAISDGIEQLVILGAGLDTRAYRLPRIDKMRVFEVDLSKVQINKKAKLANCLGGLPPNVAFVPIDFNIDSLESAFAPTSYDPSKRAVFIWEGVTQYIPEDAVRKTLAFVGKSASGSRIAFTYVLKSIIDGNSDVPGARRLMTEVAKQGAPWIFGLDPESISQYLEPFHLVLKADVGRADYNARYLTPMNRTLVVSDCERLAEAVVR
jgi:methyltransferase (TIGR00027 family)